MQLKTTGKEILQQLLDLTAQLNESEYSTQLDILNENSIGKHVRHIIEFFDILIHGSNMGTINYDHRSHAIIYETDLNLSIEKIEDLIERLETLSMGMEVILEVSYDDEDAQPVQIKSSIDRELAYNIEHAIHHMAIVKMAVQIVFPEVQLSCDFGVAYSTVRYRKSQVR